MPLSYQQMHSAVRVFVNDEITVPLSLAVAWDNAPAPDVAPHTGFVRVSIDDLPQRQRAFGQYRMWGTLFITTFTPLLLGDKNALDTASAVVTALRGKASGGVHYRIPSPDRAPRRDKHWWRLDIATTFWADDFA